jgi:trimethylamine--corrinoid protein Co-methyltransferase
LAQLVICNEIGGWIETMMAPVEVNDETMAIDLIDEIGPDGQFLGTDHTLKYFRDRWFPEVFEHGNYDQWKAAGGKSLGERAVDRVKKILAEHRPEPLPKEIAQQVRAVVQRAEG